MVYGATASYGSAISSATLTTSHGLTISGLRDSSSYHFAVVSTDAGGNTSTSSDQTFATATTAPAIALNWSNQVASSFLAGGTSWNIGSTNASTTCGTIGTGDLLIAAESVWTNGGGDPGTLSVPTGWTLMWTNFINDFRSAVLYKIATGNESCSFASSWTTSSVARTWALMDFTYAGVAPSSPIDASSSQAASISTQNMVTPSVSPTNSNDLLLGIFTETGSRSPYTGPGDMTTLINNNLGMIIAEKALTSSGPTGSETAADSGAFTNVVTGLAALSQ